MSLSRISGTNNKPPLQLSCFQHSQALKPTHFTISPSKAIRPIRPSCYQPKGIIFQTQITIYHKTTAMGSPTCHSLPPSHRSTLRHLSPHSTARRSSSRHHNHQHLQYSLAAPPTLTTAASTTLIARPDLNRASTSAITTTTSRASTLLSKVACSAPGSRRGSPAGSVVASPVCEKDGMHFGGDGVLGTQLEVTSPRWEDVLRYWYGSEKRGKLLRYCDWEMTRD